MAKAEGQPRPTTALVAAMIVAALCTLTFGIAMVSYQRDQKNPAGPARCRAGAPRGQREAATLDPKVACDVVEEFLVEHGHGEGAIRPRRGALRRQARRPGQASVAVGCAVPFNESNYSTVTACLERRSRWYVIKLLDAGSCAELPPPAPFTEPPRQLSDGELAADEKAARENLAKAGSAQAIRRFTDKLAKVKAHAASQPGGERMCTKAEMARLVADGGAQVDTVDFDLLDGGRTAGRGAS